MIRKRAHTNTVTPAGVTVFKALGLLGLFGLIVWSALALAELWLVPLVVGGWILFAGWVVSQAFYWR